MLGAALCCLPLAAAAAAAPAPPSPVPTVALFNAAAPGLRMPATGMGTGCAIGGCSFAAPQPFASLNMSKQWLAIGGRRFDGADSYGIEPGIGEAIKQSGVARSEVFITSKTGPGGLAWPLGYNETLDQAKQIVANYSTSYVDLLLIHWPTNYGPCSYHGPKPSIPTTDPACDTSGPHYSAKACRLSTWRAMVAVWKMGLAKAIGVSNFNTTHLKELADAGLPTPSVNQAEFNPTHGLSAKGCTPGSATETCGELLDYCKAHKIHYQGYSPYGGAHSAGKLLGDPRLAKIAAAHGTGASQVVLAWQWQLGISVNPEARQLEYQEENLHFFNFTLSAAELEVLSTWTKA
jgi:diketogulonate reductase-like aldo/keto reductase